MINSVLHWRKKPKYFLSEWLNQSEAELLFFPCHVRSFWVTGLCKGTCCTMRSCLSLYWTEEIRDTKTPFTVLLTQEETLLTSRCINSAMKSSQNSASLNERAGFIKWHHHMCLVPSEATSSPKAGFEAIVIYLTGCRVPLEEQHVLLAAEPSPQPSTFSFV